MSLPQSPRSEPVRELPLTAGTMDLPGSTGCPQPFGEQHDDAGDRPELPDPFPCEQPVMRPGSTGQQGVAGAGAAGTSCSGQLLSFWQ